MASTLMNLVAFLSLDNSKFKRGAHDSEKRMQTMGQTIKRVGGMISGYMGGRQILSAVNDWSKLGDSIEEASQRTGISVEQLSRLKYAADLSGSSLEGVETAVRMMQKNLANPATDKLSMSFRALGLSGKAMSKDVFTNFSTILQALSGVKDDTMRATLAMNIFGKSGTQVLPLIADGYGTLQESMVKAGQVGAVFTPEQASAAAAYQDAIVSIDSAWKGFLGTLATSTPLLDGVSNAIDMTAIAVKSLSNYMTGSSPGDVGFMDVLKEVVTPGSTGESDATKANNVETAKRRNVQAKREAQMSEKTKYYVGMRSADKAAIAAIPDDYRSPATQLIIASANFHATDDMKRMVNRNKSARANIQ